jgi:hypothetical protein
MIDPEIVVVLVFAAALATALCALDDELERDKGREPGDSKGDHSDRKDQKPASG